MSNPSLGVPAASTVRSMARGAASPMASAAQALAAVSFSGQRAQQAPASSAALPTRPPPSAASAASAAAAAADPPHLLGGPHGDGHFHRDFKNRDINNSRMDDFIRRHGSHGARQFDRMYHRLHDRLESKYGGLLTETRTKEKEKQHAAGEAPSARLQWTRHINMHNSAYCRVTRSYESAGISGSGNVAGLGVDIGNWTKLFMGGFNQTYSATTAFFPSATTLAAHSGVCMAFHFDTSVVTGVDGTVGPRVVRGGPTATDYMTQSMLFPEGWTEWNNDFYMFSNIFRYSKLNKLELLIKVTPHNQSGYVGVDQSPYTNNAIAYQDPGVLYVAPWSGEPGIVNSYTAGAGVMTSGAANGASNVNFWESKPGVRKIDMGKGYTRDQYQIYSFPVEPIQPVEIAQSDNSGNPIVGADTVINYDRSPTVDQFSFVSGAQNHNAFGWTLYWYHPDFSGMVTTTGGANTVIPPWIEIKFRGEMTWWGLLPPDMTAGTAPILKMAQLPGAEEARRKAFVDYAFQKQELAAELAAATSELRDAIRPAAARASSPEPMSDYVAIPALNRQK